MMPCMMTDNQIPTFYQQRAQHWLQMYGHNQTIPSAIFEGLFPGTTMAPSVH